MMDFKTQYDAVTSGLAWCDRSAVGKIAISGPDRFTWLQGMVTQDIRILANQAYQGLLPAAILDATGHVLADLKLASFRSADRGDGEHNGRLAERLHIGESEFLLVDLERASVPRVLELLDRYLITEEVTLTDISDALSCFSFYGSQAADYMEQGGNATPRHALDHLTGRLGWCQPVRFLESGGFHSYLLAEEREALRAELTTQGVVELSADVLEVLRVELGIPKYGVDMDASTLAPEAGIMPTHISLTKGCYVGQEIVARIDSRGHTNRALTGLLFREGEIPSPGDRIYALEEGGVRKETGRITSVVESSPAMSGRPIALGYVRHEHRTPGSALFVSDRDGKLEGKLEAELIAEAHTLPFRSPLDIERDL